MRKSLTILLLVVAGGSAMLAAGGCAASPQRNTHSTIASPADANSSADTEFNEFEEELKTREVKVADPLEGVNRVMYGFNDVLYFWVIKPVAQTWKDVVPVPGRIGISNFFGNLATPVRLVNCLLQGKNDAAGREVNRFLINTTAGVLGFGDPAKDKCGLEPADEDLGQSLAKFGFGDGFYLVLPLLGPSTLRDAVGKVGDGFLNPVYYVEPVEVAIGITATRITNEYSFHIGDYELLKKAVDPYVAMRQAYIQYRKNVIEDKDTPAADPNLPLH
jgi:phospholipid-binding lipoprotein MlaA